MTSNPFMHFSKHAERRFNERLSISQNDLFERLSTQSVLERIEKTGERHLILWIPEEREFFCFVISNDQIITLMPLIWRAKQISENVLEEARLAVESNKKSIGLPIKSKKVSCRICTTRIDECSRHFHSDCMGVNGMDNDKLLEDFRQCCIKWNIKSEQIYSLEAEVDNKWIDLTELI